MRARRRLESWPVLNATVEEGSIVASRVTAPIKRRELTLAAYFDIDQLTDSNAFASLTQRVIWDQGFAEFLPVACFPARRKILTLAEIPPRVDLKNIAIKWAKSLAKPHEEYFVAFKQSESEFKVIRREGTTEKQSLLLIQRGEYQYARNSSIV